jgi:hypothetical protein
VLRLRSTNVPDAPPALAVTAPPDGAVVPFGTAVALRAAASDREDGDLTAAITWTSSRDGLLGTGGAVDAGALGTGTHVITARVADRLGQSASDTRTLAVDAPPAVTITAPPSGTLVAPGSPVTLTATATDPEDGDLTASLTWTSSRDGVLGTGSPLTVSMLGSGAHTITASVADHLGTARSASIDLVVDAPPTISVTTPPDGASLMPGTPVTLAAAAADAEDGDLGARVRWSSDRSGPLGTGSPLTVTLVPGLHAIRAEVTDGAGQSASAAVSVMVNAPPVIAILAPAENALVSAGTELALLASASDAEDGDLGTAVSWTSDLDGLLGTGAGLTVALSQGVHVLFASVADSRGAAATATRQVVVRDDPPAVSILFPADGTALVAGDPLLLEGAALDVLDGDLATGLAWTSSLDGPLGTGRAFVRTTLSTGPHTITAAVADRGGHVGTASITVRVSPPTIALDAVADTYVQSSTPAANYGLQTILWVDASPVVVQSFLRFQVTGAGGLAVRRARLRLMVDTIANSQSRSGGEVRAIPDTGWVETTLNYDTRPPVGGPALSGAGPVVQGQVVEFDVTPAVTGDGTHVLALTTTDGDGVFYRSREAASGGPVLVLDLASVGLPPPPQVTITSPSDPHGTVPGSPVTFAATAVDRKGNDLSHALRWTSDRDGLLGSGPGLIVDTLSLGAHTVTATVTDADGLTGSASVRVSIRLPSLAFTPVADAYVDASLATTNFGSNPLLTADASPVRQVFVRFVVSGLGDAPPDSAVLRLTVAGASGAPSDQGGTVHAITDTGWDETTLTYTRRPPIDGPALASAGPVAASETIDLDVTPAIRGDGTYVFALVAASADVVGYVSREGGAGAPALLLTSSGPPNGLPAVTITAPPGDSVIPLGAALTLVATATDPEDGDVTARIAWTSSRDGALGTGGSLTASGLSPGAHTITAQVTDDVGQTGTAARTILVNEPPAVAITAPASGTTVDPLSPITLAGTATDPEDGDLAASITWTSSLAGPLGTGSPLTVALASGSHTITATVADRHGSTRSATTTLLVNARPAVTITAPAGGAIVQPGASITLTATATDAEDGDLSSAVGWTSSLDGLLGTGAAITVGGLRTGTHVIAAVVTDGGGRMGAVAITVAVDARPTLAISAPGDGTVVMAGAPVDLVARASDAEDGNLSATIRWSSSLSGALGTGTPLSVILPAGLHTIRAEVTDGRGQSTASTVSVIVNAPPRVDILAPAEDAVVPASFPLALRAEADDPEDGDLGGAVIWTSDLDGLLGFGDTLTVTLSEGPHRLTAMVTDFRNATATATRRVIVRDDPPAVTISTPADGAAIVAGDPLLLEATAVDVRDGDLSAALAWTSSLDGPLGTGPALVRFTLSPGTHAITAAATDQGGHVGMASITVHVRPASAAFRALADAYVDASAPTTNRGSVTTLRADGSPVMISFLRFEVSGSAGLAIRQARLRLMVDTINSADSPSGGEILAIPDTGWSEQTITYASRPPADGSPLATAGAVTRGQIVDFDVTPAVTGDGAHVFVLRSADANGVFYRSREAADGGPELLVDFASVGVPAAPVVTIGAPAADTALTQGLPLTLAATATDRRGGDVSQTIRWASDRDGLLGSGPSLTVDTLSAGTHVITAAATDADGLTGSATIGVLIRGTSLAFTVTADTYVDASAASANFGRDAVVMADASPVRQAFLRFVVSGQGAVPPGRATLRLTVGSASGAPSDQGGAVHAVADTGWSEAGLTYDTRPAVDGPTLASAGAVAAGQAVDFDVSGAIRGDGTYVFALVTPSADGVSYVSREGGAGAPRLLLANFTENQAPAVMIVAPADGAEVEIGVALTLRAVASDVEDGDLSAAVAWASDLEGPLGTGATVTTSALRLGSHRITASVTDGAGATGSASVSVTVTGRVLTLAPAADAGVKADAAGSNFGTAAGLFADGSPVRRSYLRFVVSGIGGGRVTRATLRLTVRPESGSGSAAGGTLHALTPSPWTEAAITYATSPPVDGPAVATAGAVVEGQVVDFDVTGAVAVEGTYEFALETQVADRVEYGSREAGALGPRLVLIVE